jgi:predicted metal-dependent hydrolase
MNYFTQPPETASGRATINMQWIKKMLPRAFLIVVLIVAITLLFVLISKAHQDQLKDSIEAFESIRVGNNSYKVHEDLTDPKFAAETMDALNQTAQQMITLLNRKYINNQQGIDSIKPEYRDIVQTGIISLTKNFKTANMEENIPERSGGDTSYVIDKGDVFAMCLRDPKNNNIVDVSNDMNELKFVLLHEMAHLFTSTFGHDSLFWNNFKFILEEASLASVYTPINYKKSSHPYCGIIISYSPLYDTELKEYVNRLANNTLIRDKFMVQHN